MHAIEPIGYFHSEAKERYAVARQGSLVRNFGQILLNKGFEQALADLAGFDHIWLIYGFHKNTTWKAKVLPPRGGQKRGVFATRSPHRPNFLGLSCVKLKSVGSCSLEIEEHDLIDGTPIYDIKPYLVYADSFPHAKQGWVDSLEDQQKYTLVWSSIALEKADYLKREWNISIEENVTPRLQIQPFPLKNNRIRSLQEGLYEIAYKSWRLSYTIQGLEVNIRNVYSGYPQDTQSSKWNDLPVHQSFWLVFN